MTQRRTYVKTFLNPLNRRQSKPTNSSLEFTLSRQPRFNPIFAYHQPCHHLSREYLSTRRTGIPPRLFTHTRHNRLNAKLHDPVPHVLTAVLAISHNNPDLVKYPRTLYSSSRAFLLVLVSRGNTTANDKSKPEFTTTRAL